MTSRPGPEDPRLRWWEGVASPGPGGYVAAVLVSLLAIGVLAALVDGSSGTVLGVVLFGSVFALFLAPPGVLVVHLLTLRVRAQAVHVLVTGLVGAVAGWLVIRDAEPFVLMMGLATATGRAAVSPLVSGVRRRRQQREQRRAALAGLAARGVVDGYGSPHRRPGSAAAPPADFEPDRPPR